MTKRTIGQEYPAAAYLYVLHLDGPALAWEYLRRNPDYRKDWHRRRAAIAPRWGLRLLEDPAVDARDAHPVWHPDNDIQLYPDATPPPGARLFELWRLPGHKHLIHDGCHLRLTVCWPGCCLRLVLTPELAEGMACVCAIRACTLPYRTVVAELGKWAEVANAAVPVAAACPRPSSTALKEQHTLQALDATLAGASLRETAIAVFGAATVADDWHSDSGLRSRIRRLVSRGNMLMCGGYRCLAQGDAAGKGRFASEAKRP